MEKILIDKKEFAKYCKKLSDKGFSPGYSGNVSVRTGESFFISCSGKSLGDVEEDDIIQVDFNGNQLSGQLKPSSEKNLHLNIYKMRKDINAIVHCHAPKSSAFAVAGIPLTAPILSENILVLGDVPVAKYLLPSSDELAQETASYFDKHSAVLMANHGVIVGGDNLKNAYYKIETLEYYAEVYLLSKLLGRTNTLNSDEVAAILELKTQHLVH